MKRVTLNASIHFDHTVLAHFVSIVTTDFSIAKLKFSTS